MDSAALPSLTQWLDGIDRWAELAPLLPVLVILELVLSADNAIALAAITKQLNTAELRSRALNIGIAIALVFRIILILMAQWALSFWPLKLLAGLYLLSLFVGKLLENRESSTKDNSPDSDLPKPNTLYKTIFLLAFTDLAFSIDSVAAAVAISDQYLLVISGGVIGVLALRFTSGLFIRWLEIYPRLELAGYIAVGLVGIKLLIYLVLPSFLPPEWLILVIVSTLFTWGFSIRNEAEVIVKG